MTDPESRKKRDREIIAAARRGISRSDIAAKYGIGQPRLLYIIKRDAPDLVKPPGGQPGPHEHLKERNERIVKLWQSGKTYSEIAKEMSLRQQRIRQILRSCGVMLTSSSQEKVERNRKMLDAVSQGESQASVAERLGLSEQRTSRIIKREKKNAD